MNEPSSLPQITILIENPRKSTNWGPLLRCCTAFGIRQIFVVGFDTCSVQGSHGASKHVELLSFHTHAAAIHTIQQELGFTIVGLLQGAAGAYATQEVHCVASKETLLPLPLLVQVKPPTTPDESSSSSLPLEHSLPKSIPLHCRPFASRTCLAVGKRTKGLPLSLATLCDVLVHIPTCDLPGQEGLLTVEASMSIVLHEFALWAGYGRHSNGGNVVHYQGQKYQVEKKQRGDREEQLQKQEQRKAQREQETTENPFERTVFHDNQVLHDDTGDY